MPSIPVSEKQWRQEEDARILAEAERIKTDSSRLKGAQAAAKRIVSEKQKEVQSMSKIATKTSAPKRKK